MNIESVNINAENKSFYYIFRNQEIEWLDPTEEEEYQKNIVEKYDELKKYGWIDNKVIYKFNSYGFRCDEFTDEPTLMALGCSNTLGQGIPVEHTWSKILSQHAGLRCANLAQAGGSPDTAFRMCSRWIDIIKPKVVAYLEPPPYRTELLHYKQGAKNLSVGNYNSVKEEYSKFYNLWIMENSNYLLNYEKNKLAIKYLCYERNIKFITRNDESLNKIRNRIDNRDRSARDLSHAGYQTNVQLAMDMLKDF